MKKLFSLLIVLISIKCFGQVYQVLPQYGYEMKRVNATLVLLLPSDTVTNKTGVARIGTVLYSGNGTKWTATSTDTTSLSSRINLKVNIADTATMLTPYLRKIDTASLSNRINLKVNISDTATMLTPYAKVVDLNLKANINSPTFTGTVGGITQSMVGLGNVTNESKATMFTNATFTGTFATAAGAIGNASLANGAVANLSGTNTGDQTTITGNAGTATALQTARTIGTTTGDATSAGSTFNGTANNTNALTLATVNANVGSFGSATQSPTYTVNGKGLITAAANVTITPAVGSISGLGTGVATALGVNTGSAGAVVLFNGNAGTPSALIGTNITGTASLNINGTVGATTATTGAFTTATASTSLTTPLLIGGTTTTSPLTFKTTTGVGTTGADHIFQVGNNGATEAMRILNDATIGIGTTTPTSKLDITTNSLGATQTTTSGLALVNNTAATSLAQVQISPAIRWRGNAWSSSLISKTYDFRAFSQTANGGTNPAATWKLQGSSNGAAFSDILTVASGGSVTASANFTAPGIVASSTGITLTGPFVSGGNTGTAGQVLTSNGSSTPTWAATSAPSLTSTRIAFGSAGNQLTSSNGLTFDETNGGTFKVEGGNALYYLYASGDGNKAVFYNNDVPLSFGINTSTPSVALEVVGDVKLGVGFYTEGFINYDNAGVAYIGDKIYDGNGIYLKVDDGAQLITAQGAVQMNNYGAGTATFDASGNITSVSDERLKTNIKSYKTGLKELLQLKPIQYKWNDKSKMETEGTYAGFSAQNVKANIPLGTGENKEGYLSLQDRAIMATLVNAVKELNTKIENLEKQNAKLVKKLNKKPKKVILKY